MDYKIIRQTFSYPQIDVVTGEQAVLDEAGKPVVHLEQVLDKQGKPVVRVIADKSDKNVLRKVLELRSVPKMQQIVEALPNEDAEPDGVNFQVEAWDESLKKPQVYVLDFHIGRGAFENYEPHQRENIVRKEVEILFDKARKSWTDGLDVQ